MLLSEITEYVEHFRIRVVQDALLEATTVCWRRRAEVFDAVAPRAGDFTGRATAESIDRQRARAEETARACRARAGLMLDVVSVDEIRAALRRCA